MPRSLLVVFALLAALGIAITLWASFGDASVTATAGVVYATLEAHGLGDDIALQDNLYDAVLRLRWPWAVVQGLGLAVSALAILGFVLAWRRRGT